MFDLLLEQEAAPEVRSRFLNLAAANLFSVGKGTHPGQIYLNVGHTGLDKPAHGKWLVRSNVQPVYFVHDLIPLTHPEYCRPSEREKHRRRMIALLSHGAGIISNSRETLNELAIFTGLQGALHLPPAVVAPLGVPELDRDSLDSQCSQLPGRPYFVMLGTIEGRKNHLLILNIWAEMARRLGSACPQLVIIGQRGWECEQAVDMLDRCDAIRGHVIELARCGDDLLRAYLAGARALLFPSFVEGYGLPLVEALAMGAPVIASDLPVFRELAGTIPEYLSPIDGAGWMRAIADYSNPMSIARTAQLDRSANWQAPSWHNHFAVVDRWLAQFEAGSQLGE